MTESQSNGTSQFPMFVIQTLRQFSSLNNQKLIVLGFDAGTLLQKILPGGQQFLRWHAQVIG
jgi:hypothetical protein